MTILRCEKLSKSFDGTTALAGVSVQFPRVGIVAIIGANGAGKTTLLNVITGFRRADSGRVWLGERDITCEPPGRIARLGVTRSFQDSRVIQEMLVLDNVMLGRPRQRDETLWSALVSIGVARDEAVHRRAATDLLRFVGLADKSQYFAGELSFGEQKLLALACCLSTESKILLLDEPVTGVHLELAERICGLMIELRKQERLIVLIEHDLATVRKVADELIVMDKGKIIAQGAPVEVLRRPDILESYIA